MPSVSAIKSSYEAAIKQQRTYTKTYMKNTGGEGMVGIQKGYRTLEKGATEGEYSLKVWDKKDLMQLLKKVAQFEKLDSKLINKDDVKLLNNKILDAILNAHQANSNDKAGAMAELAATRNIEEISNILAELTAAAASAAEREELYDKLLELMDPELISAPFAMITPMWRQKRYSIYNRQRIFSH